MIGTVDNCGFENECQVISLKALLRKVMEHKSLQTVLPSNPTSGVDDVNKTNIDNTVPIASPTLQKQQQQVHIQFCNLNCLWSARLCVPCNLYLTHFIASIPSAAY